jgi:hypothetical protein
MSVSKGQISKMLFLVWFQRGSSVGDNDELYSQAHMLESQQTDLSTSNKASEAYYWASTPYRLQQNDYAYVFNE